MVKIIIVALRTHKSQQPTWRCTGYHFRLQFRRAWVQSPIELIQILLPLYLID